MLPTPWQSLEELPSLMAVLPIWRDMLGDNYSAFYSLCLEISHEVAEHFPCPYALWCAYRITRHPGEPITGQCEHAPAACGLEHVQFTEADVTFLELNWQKLARALCRALNLDYRFRQLGLRNTVQLGSWSTDAVPAILTIQYQSADLRRVIAELVATLNQKFILLTPTSRMTDAPSLQLLARVQAATFPLEATVTLSPSGTLLANTTPGKLFCAFTPQPKELDLSVAERAFKLIRQFDPRTLRVFELYCLTGLSAQQVARKLGCSKATVVRRLQAIQQKTGLHAKYLRSVSDQTEARGRTPISRDSLADAESDDDARGHDEQ